MSKAPTAALKACASAEVIVDAEAVTRAVDRIAVRITLALCNANPLALCMMHGGLLYCGKLLERLSFPLQLGYVHVGRYRDAAVGGALKWRATPAQSVAGREVLIIDDVLDQGASLAAVCGWAKAQGAAKVWTTVLVRKDVPGGRSLAVDFVALNCPNRFLIGCGMDYGGYGRNLPDIRALPVAAEVDR